MLCYQWGRRLGNTFHQNCFAMKGWNLKPFYYLTNVTRWNLLNQIWRRPSNMSYLSYGTVSLSGDGFVYYFGPHWSKPNFSSWKVCRSRNVDQQREADLWIIKQVRIAIETRRSFTLTEFSERSIICRLLLGRRCLQRKEYFFWLMFINAVLNTGHNF